jgi:hypothetical protein
MIEVGPHSEGFAIGKSPDTHTPIGDLNPVEPDPERLASRGRR